MRQGVSGGPLIQSPVLLKRMLTNLTGILNQRDCRR
jgi:hypothetical protein